MTKIQELKQKIVKSNVEKNQIINNNIGKNDVIKKERLKRQSEREKEQQRQRSRERERHARGNRKYGQAKLKHAKKGVLSCVFAVIVFVLLAGLLGIAYMSRGVTAGYIGGVGMIAMIFAGTGFISAIRGFKEREKDYLTCKIGLVCNLIFLIGFIAIFCRGLF